MLTVSFSNFRMSNLPPQIMQMNDQEYWSYLERCNHLSLLLSTTIDMVMRNVFSGRFANDPEQWEVLLKAMNQASLMKAFLEMNCANLINLADDFIAQAMEWQHEIDSKLK